MAPPFGSWPDLILESNAAFLQSPGDPWGDAAGAPSLFRRLRRSEGQMILPYYEVPLGDPFRARNGRVFVLR